MYSEDDITQAVANGIISQEAADAFRNYTAQRLHKPPVDEEDFRLISSFNDIFVVVICLLLLTSVALIGGMLKMWVGALAVTVVSWALSEIFTLRRRMALPSILLVFSFFVGALETGEFFLTSYHAIIINTFSGGLALMAIGLHWWRFRVPITVAIAIADAGLLLMVILGMLFPEIRQHSSLLLFLMGLVAFALAMRWDMSDPQRRTRRADVAFWLHLLAAPLLVVPIFLSLGVSGGHVTLAHGLIILALYLVIAFVSLTIDRRALMTSALFYVLFAMAEILKEHGWVNDSFAITGLVIGSALLVLSIFWHPVRGFLVGKFPPSLQSRLPVSR